MCSNSILMLLQQGAWVPLKKNPRKPRVFTTQGSTALCLKNRVPKNVEPCVVKTFEHLCLRTRIATARKASRGGLYPYNRKPMMQSIGQHKSGRAAIRGLEKNRLWQLFRICVCCVEHPFHSCVAQCFEVDTFSAIVCITDLVCFFCSIHVFFCSPFSPLRVVRSKREQLRQLTISAGDKSSGR